MEGNELESADRIAAEKDLVEFMRSFALLTATHIRSIRETMGDTTELVLEGVSKISLARESKRKMAKMILVKRTDSSTEENDSGLQGADADFKAVAEENGEVALSDKLEPKSQKLFDHVQRLGSLESEMETSLFSMVGTLSTDDVVGQRLEHVGEALESLNSRLTDFISKMGTSISQQAVLELEKELLSELSASYTMQREHDTLQSVFGDKVAKVKINNAS